MRETAVGIHLTIFSSMPNYQVRNTNEFVPYLRDRIVRCTASSAAYQDRLIHWPEEKYEPTRCFRKALAQ